MENENGYVNKYLTEIHKIIRSGNPRFISYIAKEYMKYRRVNPHLSDLIQMMISEESTKNPESPYAIFMDDDGSINLENINEISRISDVSQFIKQVEELSKVRYRF